MHTNFEPIFLRNFSPCQSRICYKTAERQMVEIVDHLPFLFYFAIIAYSILVVLRTEFAYCLTCTPHLAVVELLQLGVQFLTIVWLAVCVD